MALFASSLTSGEFKQVKKQKISKELFSKYFVIRVYAQSDLSCVSYGIVISRKIANACKRNKVKRRLRHIISNYSKFGTFGCRIVIYARKKVVEANFEDIEKIFLSLINKLEN